ncbi:hypothetical protein ACR3AO_001732 [Bacillus wiedmannii]
MNNPRFLIKKVVINNFRGYRHGDFEFFKDSEEKRGLVLLGGPNGYGKTSLLDAIEWCLSGTIRRIQEDYEIRKEKSNSLQIGLIRHNPSEQDVSVLIEADIQGNTVIIERIFNKEQESKAFSVEESILKINGVDFKSSTIDRVLNEEIANMFYDRYICSYDKNIKIYEKSRDDIYQMFSAFFGGTQEIENIINNLEGYQRKSGKQKKLVYGVIKQLEEELDILNVKKDEANKILKQVKEERESYLNVHKKQGELQEFLNLYLANIAIELDSSPQGIISESSNYEQKLKEVQEKQGVLEGIKYLVDKRTAYTQGKKYIEHLGNAILLEDFRKEVLNPYQQYEEAISKIKSLNLGEVKEKLGHFKQLKMRISHLTNTSQEVNKVLLDYAQRFFDGAHTIVQKIKMLELKVAEKEILEEDLKKYNTTKPVIKALRALVDHMEGFEVLHKSQHQSCPLCGSKEFFSSTEIELAQDAKRILGEVDSKRNNLQIQYNSLEKDLKEGQEYIKKYIINYLGEEISRLEENIAYFSQTEDLRLACLKFQLNFNDLDIRILKEIEDKLNTKVLDTLDVFLIEQGIIRNLSNQSNQSNKLEGVPSTLNHSENIEVKEFLNLSLVRKKDVLETFIKGYELELNNQKPYLSQLEIENISVKMLETQLSVWRRVGQFLLSDRIIKDIDGKLLKIEQDFRATEILYNNKDKEINKLKTLLSNLKKVRSEWDKKVADEIRVPFKRMYRRLTRHTNINDIDLKKDGRTTQKAKIVAKIASQEIFAPNILSAGQLSTMSLAIFLTVAMGQKNQSFRCYFMDEPIQTMDDLNVLSFVDLLRTELLRHTIEQDSFVDQLILTTCDEDFENLVHHKMQNFDVNFTHIHFTSYGEYEFKS